MTKRAAPRGKPFCHNFKKEVMPSVDKDSKGGGNPYLRWGFDGAYVISKRHFSSGKGNFGFNKRILFPLGGLSARYPAPLGGIEPRKLARSRDGG